jgi:hypothetical protein
MNANDAAHSQRTVQNDEALHSQPMTYRRLGPLALVVQEGSRGGTCQPF